MSLSKFLDPKNDFAFKRIFGTEKNQDILIHFINDMLKFTYPGKIQKVSFLKTTQDPEIASKKQSLVDVLCTDEVGRQYIVEMQVVRTRGFEKRAQYYAAKAYSRQLNQGDPYHRLNEIIFLAITDFVMFPQKIAYKSDHVILDNKTFDHDLKDFYFSFLELPKFTKTVDELETIVEKWAYFFKHAEETQEADLEKIIGSDLILQRAYEELNRFSWSEIELNTYEQEEKRERDAQAIIDQREFEFEQRELAFKAKAAQIDAKAAQVDEKAAQIDEKAAQIDEKAAQIDEKAAQIDEKAAQIDEKAAQIEVKASQIEAKGVQVEAKKTYYLEQGIEQGIETIAKKMLAEGIELTLIAKLTGLSLETLKKLY